MDGVKRKSEPCEGTKTTERVRSECDTLALRRATRLRADIGATFV